MEVQRPSTVSAYNAFLDSPSLLSYTPYHYYYSSKRTLIIVADNTMSLIFKATFHQSGENHNLCKLPQLYSHDICW